MKMFHILQAEDNEGDILLTSEALADTKLLMKLSVVKDGKHAIDFLNQTGLYKNESLPDLILLDVNMPKLNGHRVLKYVKEHEYLKHIPIIMFSTSCSQKDIDDAYQNHVNCFITKPVDLDNFVSVIALIKSFWFSTVLLPTNNLVIHA